MRPDPQLLIINALIAATEAREALDHAKGLALNTRLLYEVALSSAGSADVELLNRLIELVIASGEHQPAMLH